MPFLLLLNFKIRTMQKKRFTLLFILLFSIGGLVPCMAQNLNYDWSLNIGGADAFTVVSMGIATDAAGNTYTTGMLVGTADFDPGPGTANLTAAGLMDIYIVKYDPNGNYVWAKNIPGKNDTSGTNVNSIALDRSGNIFVGGGFEGVVDFDPDAGTAILNSTSIANTQENMFIAKYDANGNYLWAKSETGDGGTFCRDLAVDAEGDVYLTGILLTDTAKFGPGFNVTRRFFISKYSSGGDIVWAHGIGGSDPDESQKIEVDSSGNVYVAGYIKSAVVDFDPSPDFEALFSSTGIGWKMFIAKYTTNGNYVWAEAIGGTSVGRLADMTLDDAGYLYVTGDFSGEMEMDPDTAVDKILTSKGAEDIYLAKYDTSGRYVWAKSMGGTSYDRGLSVICANGNVYLQGVFKDTVDFDPAETTTNLVSDKGNGVDIFISRYDLNGHYLWAGSFTGTGVPNLGKAVCVDKANNLYCTGVFQRDIDMDPGLGIDNRTASGLSPFSFNPYIVKFNPGCKQFLGFTESTCDSFVFNGNAYKASGIYADTFLTSTNCDSISTLYLTITGRTSVHPTVTAHYCDSVSMNGITYKTSGIYTQHYTTITGCDSNFVYDLTIGQNSTTTSAFYTACDSFAVNDTLVFTSSSFRTVTFTNVSGCDSVVVLDITINPSPQAGITRDGATLTASGTGSYQWINCDGNNAIAGATAQQYTPAAIGRYAVVVTSIGCTDTSDCIEVNNTNLINGPDNYNKVQLYPNPTTNHVTLQTINAWNNASIRLINTIGQTLAEYINIKGSLLTIDMTAYPAGIYIVEISEGNETARLKLTKE